MDEDEMRILVCLIVSGIIMLGSFVTFGSNPLTILSFGIGALILIYGFSPDTASDIIQGIVDIVTSPFKK